MGHTKSIKSTYALIDIRSILVLANKPDTAALIQNIKTSFFVTWKEVEAHL